MELVKGLKRIDYYFLDQIFIGLEFFRKSNYAIRKEIIQKSNFRRYGAGQAIYNQGDIANHVFLVLRGSVNIR